MLKYDSFTLFIYICIVVISVAMLVCCQIQ